MSKKSLNFNLGSRGLTEAETAAVENAKALLRSSLERHRKDVYLVFAPSPKPQPAAKAAAKPAAKSAAKKAAPMQASQTSAGGSATWKSNKVAPAIRKY